jgi:hypothetical protein
MKSTRTVLATILFFFFALALFAQHGATAGAGASSVSHSSPSPAPSPAPAMHTSTAPSSHASSGSHTSSGSTASRGVSNIRSGTDSHAVAAPPKRAEVSNSKIGESKKNDIVQNKDGQVKDKGKVKSDNPSPGKERGEKEHARRSWLPWKKHSDDPGKKGDHKDKEKNKDAKKEKCKPGKPCRGEVKVAQADNLKCIHGPCKVCPPGYFLNKAGVCTTTPPTPTLNCPPGTIRTGQTVGQPCSGNQGPNNCTALADEIQREELELQRIQNARQVACAQGPSNQECVSLNMDYDREALRLEQLRRDYNICMRR